MAKVLIGFFLWLLTTDYGGGSKPCALRDYGQDRQVCVCNATYCDTIDRVPKIEKGKFKCFISSIDGLRFNETDGELSEIVESNGEELSSLKNFSFLWWSSLTTSVRFTVNPTIKYQKIIGFGGAFTDAAGINILSLGKETQEHLLRSYFSVEGIEYNLCRVPIGGTDFSTHPYSYDDGSVDPGLQNFSLTKEDLKYKIPLIQRAASMSERELRLISASWSPPPWMKSNNQFSGFAYLKEQYYDLYARYLIRFLDEYKKHDVKIWAVSTGNEPSNGIIPVNKFNSLGWTPLTMASWTTNYFGPKLRSSAHNDTIILAFDDQRLFLPWWIDLMVMAEKGVLQYIDGFAVHWYWDFLVGPGVISSLHEKYPDKSILYTEACVGDKPWENKVDFGSWERGEKYMSDIIQNVNVWVSSWLDWNLCLDENGGPTWAKNFVDSPILVNKTANEFYKQPMFYAMGHVTKFIERDSFRVDVSTTGSSSVQATAVENPDGRIVIVMLNENNSTVNATVDVLDRPKGRIKLTLPPRSFATILC